MKDCDNEICYYFKFNWKYLVYVCINVYKCFYFLLYIVELKIINNLL